ncbi:MAG: GtrA family protein [Bdellovibrionales bacterium]|nr:GtrA family protein [Bdellovibrionales bacterium]
MHYLLSTRLFFTGVFAEYRVNNPWMFDIEPESPSFISKYLVVYVSSLTLTIFFLTLPLDGLGFSAKIANLIAIGITTCANFVGTKIWVFQK